MAMARVDVDVGVGVGVGVPVAVSVNSFFPWIKNSSDWWIVMDVVCPINLVRLNTTGTSTRTIDRGCESLSCCVSSRFALSK